MSHCLSQQNGIKARKRYRCVLCGERIDPGDLYDKRTGVGDDSFWKMRMHPECHAYEQVPGTVDYGWYDDITHPAFDHTEALAHYYLTS